MKVLHVDTGREWRGGQTQMLHLIRRQPGEVHVALPGDAPIIDTLRTEGVPVHPVPFRGAFRGTRALRAVVRQVAPDVIAAQTSHGHGHAVRAAGTVPVVVHRRVDFPLHTDPFSRYKYQRPSGFIAVSRAVGDILVSGGVDPAKIRVVHDGIDGTAIDAADPDPEGLRRELGVPVGCPLILAVGALVDHKAHWVLVDAMQQLRRSWPEARCVVAGVGPLADSLQERVDEHGLTDAVRFLGQRNDVPRLLKSATLFCHCSVEEGMGQVVAEAMWAGALVVATRAGGVPEVVTDGKTGLLAPVADPPALAAALAAALALPPAKRQGLQALATEDARRRLSVDAMVKGTMAAYESYR